MKNDHLLEACLLITLFLIKHDGLGIHAKFRAFVNSYS